MTWLESMKNDDATVEMSTLDLEPEEFESQDEAETPLYELFN